MQQKRLLAEGNATLNRTTPRFQSPDSTADAGFEFKSRCGVVLHPRYTAQTEKDRGRRFCQSLNCGLSMRHCGISGAYLSHAGRFILPTAYQSAPVSSV
jgi:hypothetical protein